MRAHIIAFDIPLFPRAGSPSLSRLSSLPGPQNTVRTHPSPISSLLSIERPTAPSHEPAAAATSVTRSAIQQRQGCCPQMVGSTRAANHSRCSASDPAPSLACAGGLRLHTRVSKHHLGRAHIEEAQQQRRQQAGRQERSPAAAAAASSGLSTVAACHRSYGIMAPPSLTD